MRGTHIASDSIIMLKRERSRGRKEPSLHFQSLFA